MEFKNPQISIIVPVYNVEEYLSQCVVSILDQTFTNFEVILIDDGSEDNSGHICEEFAKKDERVRVFHKVNGGVSSARNLGLRYAKGDWICFVDSDDLLPCSSLQIFLSHVREDIDLVMAGYVIMKTNGDIVESPKKHTSCMLGYQEALREMYHATDFNYQGYLWCKMFRNSVILHNKISFNESISFNEDRLFIVNYICHSKKNIAYTTSSVYNYILRDSGVMSSILKGYNRKFATDFDAFVQMRDAIISSTRNNELDKLSLEGICNSYMSNHKMMLDFKEYDSRIHKHMLKKMLLKGAIPTYFRILLKPFLGYIGLLLFPKLIIGRKS